MAIAPFQPLTMPGTRAVTYSSAYTLVPTYECFNRCTYCNFRTEPGQDTWLSLPTAEQRLRSLRSTKEPSALPEQPPEVTEILILSGEVHPRSARRTAWLQRIYQICELALRLGFLPHSNVGPLSRAEMEALKAVNVSMGLMLEQVTPALLKTVHRHAPSKEPALRLQQVQQAGELGIPFTTGLLLGLGETVEDRGATLEAIAHLHRQWGHIQEVILQPYSPGTTEQRRSEPLPWTELVETVVMARQILPADITLQIPPNLVRSPDHLLACLEAGARDLGGICPKDEVNPAYGHPLHTELTTVLSTAGWQFLPRLPIYPQYDDCLPPTLRAIVQTHRHRLTLQVRR